MQALIQSETFTGWNILHENVFLSHYDKYVDRRNIHIVDRDDREFFFSEIRFI